MVGPYRKKISVTFQIQKKNGKKLSVLNFVPPRVRESVRPVLVRLVRGEGAWQTGHVVTASLGEMILKL